MPFFLYLSHMCACVCTHFFGTHVCGTPLIAPLVHSCKWLTVYWQHMFAAAAASPDEISFSICYLQIYCEVIYDMLSPTTSTNLSIREKNSQLYVEGLSVVAVDSVDKCLSLIAEGNKRRATSSTLLNDQSSRSHASLIVTCTRRSQKSNATTSVAVSNLVMVDLAGSERAKQSGVKFQQFEELKAINLSLSALGNCVSALGAGKAHIPYRDSKLTRLLQVRRRERRATRERCVANGWESVQ